MQRHTTRWTSLAGIVAALLSAVLLNLGTPTAHAAATTYYIDCTAGNDSNSGTATDRAWRSIAKANAANLLAGDRLLFKRDCTWTGPLKARWTGSSSAPIVISQYGTGSIRPKIINGAPAAVSISGRYQIIDNLEVWANQPAPASPSSRCPNQPVGWTVGYEFNGTAQYNTVQYSKANGLTVGIRFASGSYNKALHNNLVNNTVMSRNTPTSVQDGDDSGAWGVLLNADNNEVGYNYFSGNVGCSEDYVVDGASVEVYEGSSNYIHHNVTIDDSTFTELCGTTTNQAENNVYAYNLYAPRRTDGQLLLVRGRTSQWGSNPGTKFFNNTAYNVSIGISCTSGCDSSILEARNNIIVSSASPQGSALFASAPFDESNNIFWRLGTGGSLPIVNIQGGALNSTSRIADPRFTNPGGTAAADYKPLSGSPVINLGLDSVLTRYSITQDVLRKPVPTGGRVDIGAAEYGTT